MQMKCLLNFLNSATKVLKNVYISCWDCYQYSRYNNAQFKDVYDLMSNIVSVKCVWQRWKQMWEVVVIKARAKLKIY
jgi:hypothetical protein